MTEFHWIPSGANRLATSVDRAADPADPAGAIIVAHGLTGQRIGQGYLLVELGRRLAEAGLACIRFDQAGCGESTGRFVDHTVARLVEDTRAVRDWAISQPWCDDQRIGYLGISVGALGVVASESESPAGAVALWAPVFDMTAVFAATTRSGLRGILAEQGWVPYRSLPIGRSFIENLDAVDVPARLTGSPSPIMLAHCEDDAVVDIGESRRYQQRCDELNRPCVFQAFQRGGHDFADYHLRQTLLDCTRDFFCEHLAVENASPNPQRG
jgi:dipeptidyl aminopeptidase/acylaminoacyl peptidase